MGSRVTLAGQERYSLAVLCRCSATVTGAASLTVTSNRPPTFGNIYIFLYTFLVSVFFQCLGGWVFQFGSLNTKKKKKKKKKKKNPGKKGRKTELIDVGFPSMFGEIWRRNWKNQRELEVICWGQNGSCVRR